MTAKVRKKHYLKITFEAKSPLAVGSGKNEKTDKDVLKRKSGEPFIPGSAIAGVTRELVGKIELSGDTVDLSRYFGDVLINKDIPAENGQGQNDADSQKTEGGQYETAVRTAESNNSIESRILFFDANLSDDGSEKKQKSIFSTRDQVALDGDTKTAVKGAKFDMEIVEPGIRFTTYILQNLYDDESELDLIGIIASLWKENQVFFGAKTTRGYGEIRCIELFECQFVMTDVDDVKRWLDFDMYKADKWSALKELKKYDLGRRSVDLNLELRGGLSVRRYTTGISDDPDKNAPDYEQLTVQLPGNKPVPVIPGTSWAGAFRHHMERIHLGSANAECYFGKASFHNQGTQEGKKSVIAFSETQIEGGKSKVVSRNAIDRFTGGTVRTALFTEKAWFGGKTTLRISFHYLIPDATIQGLAATILDLHYGYMAVGGLTSVGRGLFKVLSINGKTLFPEEEKAAENYGIIMSEIRGGGST